MDNHDESTLTSFERSASCRRRCCVVAVLESIVIIDRLTLNLLFVRQLVHELALSCVRKRGACIVPKQDFGRRREIPMVLRLQRAC